MNTSSSLFGHGVPQTPKTQKPDGSVVQCEAEVVYHTENGDVVVPSDPIEFEMEDPIDCGVVAKSSSSIAPLWLVFPKVIAHTRNITAIEVNDERILISFIDGCSTRVEVTDLDTTWKALQKAFADGVE